jgi:ZIP family zinc transporter
MTNVAAAGVGAVAGFSIFLGLPVARLRGLPVAIRVFLNAFATGILVFLLWDILSHAAEPVEKAMSTAGTAGWLQFEVLAALFAFGVGAGLLSLVYFNGRLMARARSQVQGAAGATVSPRWLTMAIATGLGLHNLSEGLAIGQALATGALAFVGVLVIGFGLHNITEGFGIAAPMAAEDAHPSWGFLALAGLVGGGPTFVGTLIGLFATSVYAYVVFLALAAGAIVYVLNELFGLGRRFNRPAVFGWGVLAGFLLAFATDLFLTLVGA